MDSERIEFLCEKSQEFSEYCRKKNIRKRINQATIFSVMEGIAIGLPLYAYNHSEHPIIQVGAAIYGLMVGMLGLYYPSISSEKIDEEIFEEAGKLEKLLDEEQ